jgi:hypothetical protein
VLNLPEATEKSVKGMQEQWCRCAVHDLPLPIPSFPGTKLIKYLTADPLSKADGKLPSVASEEQAIAIGNLLLRAKG